MKNILIHYSEIALKGKNRDFFEQQLVDNIKQALGKSAKVSRLPGRILAATSDEEAIFNLSSVFGISSYSPAEIVPSDFTAIKLAVLSLAKKSQGSTFKVETTRSWKQFPKNSMEASAELGAHILKNIPSLKVDVKNPEITFRIEITKDKTFIYTEKIKGPGGLPVGVSGRVLCLISGGIDSPVAAYFLMKRGCPVDFIHFHSYPQTDKASIEKVEELAGILNKFQPVHKSKIYLVPILEYQKEVVKCADPKYRVILYRRLMYKIAETVAEKAGIVALVSGDNLGQVASQTVENMAVIGRGIELPIFRPLIGFDKEEIITLARKIGTYDISIEEHEDCCSLFAPKNPATKARLDDIIEEEKQLKTDKRVRQIYETI